VHLVWKIWEKKKRKTSTQPPSFILSTLANMVSFGKIYGYQQHAKVSRSLAAAKINGGSLDLVETRALNGDCKKPEYLAQWPMGKIPTFVGSDGFTLIEGRAIARYSEYL
jgi:Glutathione S-transferase, N-terminal domain